MTDFWIRIGFAIMIGILPSFASADTDVEAAISQAYQLAAQRKADEAERILREPMSEATDVERANLLSAVVVIQSEFGSKERAYLAAIEFAEVMEDPEVARQVPPQRIVLPYRDLLYLALDRGQIDVAEYASRILHEFYMNDRRLFTDAESGVALAYLADRLQRGLLYATALRFARDGLNLANRSGDAEIIRNVLIKLCLMQKLSYCEQAIAQSEAKFPGDDLALAIPLNQIGREYNDLGYFELALESNERSRDIRETYLGADFYDLGFTYLDLAASLRGLGRTTEALAAVNRAIDIWTLDDGSEYAAEKIHAFRVRSGIRMELGDKDGAKRDLIDEAYSRLMNGESSSNYPFLLSEFSDVFAALGEARTAYALAEYSNALFEGVLTTDRPHVENLFRMFEASMDMRDADLAASLLASIKSYYEGPFDVEGPFAVKEFRDRYNLARGRLHAMRAEWRSAVEYFRSGFESVDASIRSGEAGARYHEFTATSTLIGDVLTERETYVRSLWHVYDEGDPEILAEAFLAAQSLSISTPEDVVAKLLHRIGTADGSGADWVRLMREKQKIESDFLDQRSTFYKLVSLPPDRRDFELEGRIAAQLDAHIARTAEIDDRILELNPESTFLSRKQTLSVSQVQDTLSPGDAMIAIFQVRPKPKDEGDVFVFVLTRDQSLWFRSALLPEDVSRSVDMLRCGLDATIFTGKTPQHFQCLRYLGRPVEMPFPYSMEVAYQLYSSLISPAAPMIRGKRLYVVPNGALEKLPFSALVASDPEGKLYRDADWLVRHHVTVSLPSVASLALSVLDRPSGTGQSFLGLGNPMTTGRDTPDDRSRAACARAAQDCGRLPLTCIDEFVASSAARTGTSRTLIGKLTDLTVETLRRQSPLPETAQELCRIVTAFEPEYSKVLLGEAMTETALKQMSASGELRTYRYLDFATHGFAAGELSASLEPGLLLTVPADPTGTDDGYLSATEISRLEMDADLVVLSACNTATGSADDGTALAGLARAFFFAQARNLMVSHWPVDSLASVDLVEGVFSALASDPELTAAEALRRSSLAFMSRNDAERSHPSYWAPFVVVGR